MDAIFKYVRVINIFFIDSANIPKALFFSKMRPTCVRHSKADLHCLLRKSFIKKLKFCGKSDCTVR